MKMDKRGKANVSGWITATQLVQRYEQKPTKADTLLGNLPETISSINKRICQSLFLGVIRYLNLIDYTLDPLMRKRPRPALRGLLRVATFELLEADAPTRPKVVDHAVENTKKIMSEGEARFVNAILRKVPEALDEFFNQNKQEDLPWLAIRYSHPEWLVERWVAQFGLESTRELLAWDQQPAPVYVRVWGGDLPDCLKETQWEGFYLYKGKDWSQVKKRVGQGRAYVQDPSTRIAPGLVQIEQEGRVLDLCAAPGGKSMQLGQKLGAKGQLVALDLPGARIKRLRENLARLRNVPYSIVEADLLEATPESLEGNGLPGAWDVVFLDAPCSNTGVLRRRPDAKWRLQAGDIIKMASLQLKLLKKASEFVAPGGELVYNTCSIEKEENQGVIEVFLKEESNRFRLVKSDISYPFEKHHDGGGAFLLEKIKKR